jgi:hypothetical protein
LPFLSAFLDILSLAVFFVPAGHHCLPAFPDFLIFPAYLLKDGVNYLLAGETDGL